MGGMGLGGGMGGGKNDFLTCRKRVVFRHVCRNYYFFFPRNSLVLLQVTLDAYKSKAKHFRDNPEKLVNFKHGLPKTRV